MAVVVFCVASVGGCCTGVNLSLAAVDVVGVVGVDEEELVAAAGVFVAVGVLVVRMFCMFELSLRGLVVSADVLLLLLLFKELFSLSSSFWRLL